MAGGGSGKVKETAQEKAAAQIADEQWKSYQASYVPFENEFIASVTADTGSKEDMVAGKVNADIAQKMGPVTVAKTTANDGGPNLADFTGSAAVKARAGGMAQTSARQQVRDTRAGQMQNVIDLGRGQATEVTQGYGSIAANAVNDAIQDSQEDINNRGQAFSTAGSLIGAAGAVYGMKKQPADLYKQAGVVRI